MRRTHSNALYLKLVLGFVFQIKPIPINVGTAYIYNIYIYSLYAFILLQYWFIAPLFAIRMSCLPVLSPEVVCRVFFFVCKDRRVAFCEIQVQAKSDAGVCFRYFFCTYRKQQQLTHAKESQNKKILARWRYLEVSTISQGGCLTYSKGGSRHFLPFRGGFLPLLTTLLDPLFGVDFIFGLIDGNAWRVLMPISFFYCKGVVVIIYVLPTGICSTPSVFFTKSHTHNFATFGLLGVMIQGSGSKMQRKFSYIKNHCPHILFFYHFEI